MERSLSSEGVAEAARHKHWRNTVAAFANPLDAIAAASRENEVVVVCGSLYLIGWVRSGLVRLTECASISKKQGSLRSRDCIEA
jgi:dihydrofolate synthase/folylpolyglutamate synthase